MLFDTGLFTDFDFLPQGISVVTISNKKIYANI